MKKSNYELLKENEEFRMVYTNLLAEIEATPHLCFSKKKLRDEEYYQGVIKNGKKTGGTIQIIDLPTDLGLKEMVVNRIKSRLIELESEFNSYKISK
jgi:hypothetical protein